MCGFVVTTDIENCGKDDGTTTNSVVLMEWLCGKMIR